MIDISESLSHTSLPGLSETSLSIQIAKAAATKTYTPAVHIIQGADSILSLQQTLINFAKLCAEPATFQDLSYFLEKPGALDVIAEKIRARIRYPDFLRRLAVAFMKRGIQRVPTLLVVTRRRPHPGETLHAAELLGVLLLHEYRIFGVSLKAFTTNDRSGRSALVAQDWSIQELVRHCTRALFRRSACIVLMTMRDPEQGADASLAHELRQLQIKGSRWATRQRSVKAYLPLLGTLEETISLAGHRTRKNFRQYRRKAEEQFGCVFVPEVQLGRNEFLAFSRLSMYPVPDEIASWRYDRLQDLRSPFLMGLKDAEGGWLSLIGGRRTELGPEILFQMNHDGFREHSLSTVMRSYLIEHEAGKGSRRLYIEGGTPHALNGAFIEEQVADVIILRRSLFTPMIHKLAIRGIQKGDELALMLSEQNLEWRTA